MRRRMLCLHDVKRDGRGHGRNIFGANRHLHIFEGGMKSSSERFMSCVGDAFGCSGLHRINSRYACD
jgi:hypothetical protein